jgi:hypothetical protein
MSKVGTTCLKKRIFATFAGEVKFWPRPTEKGKNAITILCEFRRTKNESFKNSGALRDLYFCIK